MSKSAISKAIYIIGGIIIVLCAVKVICSGCKYVKEYFRKDTEE